MPATAASSAPGSRTVLVTFLGSVVRPMGSWMPIAGTVDLLAEVGLDAPSVRTAVFRLKKRGWLESEIRDGVRGYALTNEALGALEAGDAVIWHARQPADLDDGWCVIAVSVPETLRSKRHQLRAHLSAVGFGNVSTAVWVAPARMQPAAQQAIDELELTSYCALFVGGYAGGQDLGTLVQRSWDLAALDERYREFIAHFRSRTSGLDVSNGADASAVFGTYVELVDRWRKLPFRDPGLPGELLPDEWPAPSAIALFEDLVARLEPHALAHAASYWPSRKSAPTSA